MALKHIRTGEMISLSEPWVHKDHPDHAALAAIPHIAPLLPHVIEAHSGLVTTQTVYLGVERRGKIVVRQKRLDDRHDNLLRGVHFVVTGAALLAADEAVRQALVQALEILLPEGLLAVQKTYREKAGQGVLLKARLTPEVKALLAKTKVAERSLLDYVNELIACAAELGGLEDERAGAADDSVLPADRQAARNRWIRVVNTITQSLSLVPIEDSRIDAIRQRIDEASSAADRRGGDGASDDPPAIPQPANDVATPPLAAVANR